MEPRLLDLQANTQPCGCKSWLYSRAGEVYCKSGNFRKNFNFPKSVKRHTFDRKISRLWYDSPISVVERVVSPFLRGFYFHETSHIRSFAKIKPSLKFPNLQYIYPDHVTLIYWIPDLCPFSYFDTEFT